MRDRLSQKSISGIAALLCLAVFAVGILSVLLGGAGAYRRLTKRDSLSYDSRTCAQYLATKIRQAPSPSSVELGTFGDGDALFIYEDGCLTRVYCHEGWLMELFTETEGDFTPADGEKIIKAESLSLGVEGGLISMEIVDANGDEIEQKLFLRGGEEGAE